MASLPRAGGSARGDRAALRGRTGKLAAVRRTRRAG